MSEPTLLIVEDDPGLQSQMRWCVDGCEVLVAADAAEARTLLASGKPQVMTLDLGLPPDPGGTSQGFQLLEESLASDPTLKIIVITGREEREHALRAIAKGAYDFYQKPIDAEMLKFVVSRAFRLAEIEAENRRLSAENSGDAPLAGLITADQRMLTICRQVERVAPTDATVTILGETGTGKEVIARNIHQLSVRADGPFVAINCAAIPENLLESELFGYEKGAFTGASGRKIGKIEAAHGGTLFLDEIGDMPLPLQSKILRFLQERAFERLGGNRLIEVDVRVLSATHRALDNPSESGFREDLYFRLSEIVLTLPPLRERSGDAVLLANHFLKRDAERPLRLSAGAITAIENHGWQGNIRELENRIKRACILCEGNLIEAADLELAGDSGAAPVSLKDARAGAERSAILRALAESDSNISKAARILGVSRPTLYKLFSKYDLNPEDHG